MKTTAKVIVRKDTAKTINIVRAMEAMRKTTLYKAISNEIDKNNELGNAREEFYTKQFLVIADDKVFTRNKRKAKDNVTIKLVDVKSSKFTGLESNISDCLLAKYCETSHVISASKDMEEIKLSSRDAMKIVAAMQMTASETKALPANDDKYRIRVACQDWMRQVKHRLLKYCFSRLKRENDALLGKNATPTGKAKAKAKGKAKADLANAGKGITVEQIIALMINGCAKLSKDKAEQYLDKLADQIESLRESVNNGKAIMECEA